MPLPADLTPRTRVEYWLDAILNDTEAPMDPRTRVEMWLAAILENGGGGGADPRVDQILALIPTQASAENQLADKDFVNSSINSVSAFPITYNAAGDGFPTIEDLTGATVYYSGGAERVPTTNDYAFVVADTSKATQATGYEDFTTTTEYVGYYVMYNSVATLVTELNKNSVGITPGTTVAYIAIPSTRYVYSIPSGQTSGAWNFQTVVTPIAFTASQVKAINSGITASLVALINTAVQPTQYASASNAGVFKASTTYGLEMTSAGLLRFMSITAEQYAGKGVNYAVSKGTLDNIFTAKHLVEDNYVQITYYEVGSNTAHHAKLYIEEVN